MRGSDRVSGSFFSYVDLERRVRPDHPLRVIREIVNAALDALSQEFDALYPPYGRESIPPERLVRALLLQAFYSIRSERQLVERIEYDLLFRWFVGLGIDDGVWDATTFSKNRDRLLDGEVAAKLLRAVLSQGEVKRLLSSDHFSVDGTLIEAWAGAKSFKPKDGSGTPPDPRVSGILCKWELWDTLSGRGDHGHQAKIGHQLPGECPEFCVSGAASHCFEPSAR
jgi:transposase